MGYIVAVSCEPRLGSRVSWVRSAGIMAFDLVEAKLVLCQTITGYQFSNSQ